MAGGQPPRRWKLSVLLPDRKGRQKRNDDTENTNCRMDNQKPLGTPCGLNLERHVLDEGTTLAKYAEAIRRGGEDKEGWG